MRIVRITLTAIVKGSDVVVFDADGCRIARLPISKAKRCGPKAKWNELARRQINASRHSEQKRIQRQTPWGRKLDTWVSSIRIRQLDSQRPRKAKHNPRSTTEWKDALKRMWFEHNNAVRRTDKWKRWAYNTAKNNGRRCEARQIKQERSRAQGTA